MLPGGPLLPFNLAISFDPTWQDSFSHSCFIMAKVVAKQKNSLVLSSGYTCYENLQSSCRFGSIGPLRTVVERLRRCGLPGRKKISEERATYQPMLKATPVTRSGDGTEIYTEKLSRCRRSHGGRLRQSQFVRIQ